MPASNSTILSTFSVAIWLKNNNILADYYNSCILVVLSTESTLSYILTLSTAIIDQNACIYIACTCVTYMGANISVYIFERERSIKLNFIQHASTHTHT